MLLYRQKLSTDMKLFNVKTEFVPDDVLQRTVRRLPIKITGDAGNRDERVMRFQVKIA